MKLDKFNKTRRERQLDAILKVQSHFRAIVGKKTLQRKKVELAENIQKQKKLVEQVCNAKTQQVIELT